MWKFLALKASNPLMPPEQLIQRAGLVARRSLTTALRTHWQRWRQGSLSPFDKLRQILQPTLLPVVAHRVREALSPLLPAPLCHRVYSMQMHPVLVQCALTSICPSAPIAKAQACYLRQYAPPPPLLALQPPISHNYLSAIGGYPSPMTLSTHLSLADPWMDEGGDAKPELAGLGSGLHGPSPQAVAADLMGPEIPTSSASSYPGTYFVIIEPSSSGIYDPSQLVLTAT
ncbi:hypothetical protein BC834DRAFT_846657 [Gloeopeniophorella convolvens]|nr:hypothetical protein BC834DRAFT_846657 [Gloeopeniophorella convolvens]